MCSCFVLYACVTSECIDNPVHLKVSPERSLLAQLKVSSKLDRSAHVFKLPKS